MLTLQEVKEFLRIETTFEEEDLFLSSLLLASETFIINATHTNADKTTELFKLAQRFLILHWYENRNTVIIGVTSQQLDFALKDILLQISLTSSETQ